MSGLRLPTAEGLGALIGLNKELRARGGALALVNVPAMAFEVFRLAKLVGLLDVRRCLLDDGSVDQLEVQALSLDDEVGHATTAR